MDWDWCDAHCHLPEARTAVVVATLPPALAQAHLCGTGEEDWDGVIAAAAAGRPRLTASIGIHPFCAADAAPGVLDRLKAALRTAPRPLGIGEIGLDGALDRQQASPAAAARRRDLFLAQLELSYELGLPVSIHGRDAWPRILELLWALPPHPAGILLHAYGGAPDVLPAFPGRHIYLSLGPILLRPTARRPRRLAQWCPREALLLESDAPLDAPSPLPELLPRLAALRQETPAELATQLLANWCQLFAKLVS